MGAARQGSALAQYMVGQGANVTITDLKTADELIDSQQSLSQYKIRWVLGEHPFSLVDDKDLICISGGVPFNNPLVLEGKKRGIPVSNDSQIFLEKCPCRVIGITGSAGKTTTTSLVGAIARTNVKEADDDRSIWVGGNIGNPMISDLSKIGNEDIVVMEISSFQLEVMSISPGIAAILNITPNHLDRHGTMESYTNAKARILGFQSQEDVAILGRDDPGAWELKDSVRGAVSSFGFSEFDDFGKGTFVKDGQIHYRDNSGTFEIMPVQEVRLRGQHNLQNVLAAVSISRVLDFSVSSIRDAVSNYFGVEHRLEFVRSWGGADWYNDSIATAPERSMAAIRSFEEPIVLLAGGRDKDLPWAAFAKLVEEKVRKVIVFGEAAPVIMDALQEVVSTEKVIAAENLESAVEAASTIVTAGDIVLLSPGGTSFDEFRDFAERGENFRRWVNKLH